MTFPLAQPSHPMNTRTLAELAALVGATLEGDGSRPVAGPASLAEAGEDEVSFLAGPRYASLLETTRAAGVVVGREVDSPRGDLSLLRCEDPGRAFTTIVRAYAPQDPALEPGIDPSARVHPDASIAEGVYVGPFCVLEAGVVVGRGAVLHAGAYLGRDARIGSSCVLHPAVVVHARVTVGERCILHAGCVIGSEGFGFDPSESGWTKVPQCGTVMLEDDVEVGANSTIDRARFGATRIGRGSKIDNLVHVGHNCVLEEHSLLCAQVGLAGSTRIGRGAVLGGQVGVAGHCAVGPGARVAAQAGVFGDVPGGEAWSGWPARPRVESLRGVALTRRLPEFLERLRALEQRLEQRLERES